MITPIEGFCMFIKFICSDVQSYLQISLYTEKKVIIRCIHICTHPYMYVQTKYQKQIGMTVIDG